MMGTPQLDFQIHSKPSFPEIGGSVLEDFGDSVF
jgi:hypothetical protein